jgi:hypothetical protein
MRTESKREKDERPHFTRVAKPERETAIVSSGLMLGEGGATVT